MLGELVLCARTNLLFIFFLLHAHAQLHRIQSSVPDLVNKFYTYSMRFYYDTLSVLPLHLKIPMCTFFKRTWAVPTIIASGGFKLNMIIPCLEHSLKPLIHDFFYIFYLTVNTIQCIVCVVVDSLTLIQLFVLVLVTLIFESIKGFHFLQRMN